MDTEEIFDWLKEHPKVIMITGLFIVMIFISVVFSSNEGQADNYIEVSSLDESESIVNSENTDTNSESESSEPSIIYIDVKGAVEQPGVYALNQGERIKDAIDAAGGFKANALERVINLAQVVEDQMLLYVPEIGEETSIESDLITSNPEEESVQNELVNLNTADISALMTLNGIGEKKAQAIITYREENGSFQQTEDIMEVSGIGEKTFENLKDFISVSD